MKRPNLGWPNWLIILGFAIVAAFILSTPWWQ